MRISQKPVVFSLLRAAMLAAFSAGSLIAEEPRAPERYCNPLPIPNYAVGKLARDVTKGAPNDGGLWLSERKEQYRELADPTALWFERRIGMDPAEFDSAGNLYVPAATSTPQPVAVSAEATPWVPLNDGEPTFGSSSAPNTAGRRAADNSMMTWWLPAADDAQPVLTTSFASTAEIRAVRVIWRDVGLDTRNGAKPGPFRYRVEAETSPGMWATIGDRSASTEDFLIDYRECVPTTAGRARLVVLGHPEGIQPGVSEFTVFGPVR
ncbi:hypothetical protein [Luteolibacter sp.]|uniref:hypothetical protein n=1 Tax=Luteolibacter sp. TaxID=1962973 RepID=UPI0032644D56